MKFLEIEKFLRMTNNICTGASIPSYKERSDSNEMKKRFRKAGDNSKQTRIEATTRIIPEQTIYFNSSLHLGRKSDFTDRHKLEVWNLISIFYNYMKVIVQ